MSKPVYRENKIRLPSELGNATTFPVPSAARASRDPADEWGSFRVWCGTSQHREPVSESDPGQGSRTRGRDRI